MALFEDGRMIDVFQRICEQMDLVTRVIFGCTTKLFPYTPKANRKQILINLVAKEGYLDILKWLRDNGCSWNSDTCTYAAKGGHFKILKWARENGCRWNSITYTYAAEGGYIEVLKWLRENDCPRDKSTCM